MKCKIMLLILLFTILMLQLSNLKNGSNFTNYFSNNDIQKITNKNLETSLDKYANFDILEIEKSKNLIIDTENFIEHRANLILEIFGSAELSRDAGSVVGIDKFEEFNFHRLSTGARFFDMNSEYLLIFHGGHSQDALSNDSGGHLIRYALSKNFDVLVLNMPTGNHASYSIFKYPLAEFITPVLKSVNYVLNYNKYKSINMSGLSGGGWTTVIYSAIDERIDKSVPIAGSLPLYLRYNLYLRYKSGNTNSIGDYEQTLPGLSLGYLDLYALATTGGRQQLQVFNLNDPCCFAGNMSLDYVEKISNISKKFNGKFSVRIVESNKHEINKTEFDNLLSK